MIRIHYHCNIDGAKVYMSNVAENNQKITVKFD